MVKAKKAIPQAAADALYTFSEDFEGIRDQRMEILRRKLEEAEQKLNEEANAYYTQQIPEEILNMNFFDFLGLNQTQAQPQQNLGPMVTPPAPPRAPPGRLELKTPSGTMVLPSYITPRVDGQRKMRQSKAGELLFSVTGTPVIANAGPSSAAKENDESLLELVKKDTAEMSPATAQIVNQLKSILKKKLKE
uniref:Borealin n=1 Tax=Acrobeloides nanus TaxID=290746 RepID=A0A914DX45_9BILA